MEEFWHLLKADLILLANTPTPCLAVVSKLPLQLVDWSYTTEIPIHLFASTEVYIDKRMDNQVCKLSALIIFPQEKLNKKLGNYGVSYKIKYNSQYICSNETVRLIQLVCHHVSCILKQMCRICDSVSGVYCKKIRVLKFLAKIFRQHALVPLSIGSSSLYVLFVCCCMLVCFFKNLFKQIPVCKMCINIIEKKNRNKNYNHCCSMNVTLIVFDRHYFTWQSEYLHSNHDLTLSN